MDGLEWIHTLGRIPPEVPGTVDGIRHGRSSNFGRTCLMFILGPRSRRVRVACCSIRHPEG